MRYQGNLILQERLRKNWSQEGLCKGICTASYLSKIENGTVVASNEIIEQLLERLGIQIDTLFTERAGHLVKEGYKALFNGDFSTLKDLFRSEDIEALRTTVIGLDALLLDAFCEKWQPLDERFETCMDSLQLALQRILQHRYTEAIILEGNAFCYWQAGGHAYHCGDYAAALEYLQKGYALAADEGSVRLMLNCKVLLGNCYCNMQNVRQMNLHYAVAKKIAMAIGDEVVCDRMDYNTAAVQLEIGDYESAYRYLSRAAADDVMTLHKLAICCEKTNRADEAFAALERAENIIDTFEPPEIAEQLLAVVRYRLEHTEYLTDRTYGELLLSCYRMCREQLPYGYALFHKPFVLEWLQANRLYKEALMLVQDQVQMSL